MKQHINSKQLNELSEKGIMKLLQWLSKKSFEDKPYPKLLSIGQMIEFLDDNDYLRIEMGRIPMEQEWWIKVFVKGRDWRIFRKKEFNNALWQAVKEILNK